ncbi:MAG TPA: DUF2071 domain-containing protein [Phycisphaerales bacterium]|nr:DUF2071 domain-containing protein [Phycisphaerales bacterium]
MARTFLTAEWRNLIIVSYHVPAELLAPHLPAGLELDEIGGAPTVSLVAFEFLNTRVKGVRWPGFVNFPEWNLRFYVRSRPTGGTGGSSARGVESATPVNPERGVVFIREFVPSRLIAGIAKGLYNEPYSAAPFRQQSDQRFGQFRQSYTVTLAGRDHTLDATAADRLITPEPGSLAHLLKEHRWGFGRTRAGKTLRYEVEHPVWRIHETARCRVDVDWVRLYGPEWGVMQDREPFSVVLAEGSAISVASAAPL